MSNYETDDARSVTSTKEKSTPKRMDPLKAMIPERSYYALSTKIKENVKTTYNKVLSEFKELTDNTEIVRNAYNTEETDDSWKKDPEDLDEKQLRKEIELLEKKISYIEAENKNMDSEISELYKIEDSVHASNEKLLEKVISPPTAEEEQKQANNKKGEKKLAKDQKNKSTLAPKKKRDEY